MSRTNSDDATDVPSRIDDAERVSPEARRAAVAMDRSPCCTVVGISPCGTVEGAAEVDVETPAVNVGTALDGTGYRLRGILTNYDENVATVWIDPEADY